MKKYFTVFLILGSGIWLTGCNLLGNKQESVQTKPTPTKTIQEVKQVLETKTFKNLPADSQQIILNDPSNQGNSGIATRSFEKNKFAPTILADLPEPTNKSYYQAWLNKTADEEKTNVPTQKLVKVGVLKPQKGGWLLEYSSSNNLMDHIEVKVTLEKVNDNQPEELILAGNF